jgi:acetate kinase
MKRSGRAPFTKTLRRQVRPGVLAINGGSSSIRFAVYETGPTLRRSIDGTIERIGSRGSTLTVTPLSGPAEVRPFPAASHHAAVHALVDWLEAQPVFPSIVAVGHRVVHGMKHADPEHVTPRLLAELRRIMPYDPDHLPREIALIDAVRERHPSLPQIACFDTAFHRTMPAVARLLPIPQHYAAKGVERYGFHGLSYAYLMEELGRIDPAAAKGRVILAHLGSGASLAAVHRGKSIDTSMGFTPSSGLMMGTRTGDIDPGLAYYLSRTARMTPARFQHLVNNESGLLGVSGISADLRDVCAKEATHPRARDAVSLFCYQVTKWIGAFAAALGGLDTLVFSAGIGEHAPQIRRQICQRLGFLGIALDGPRNARNAPLISGRRSVVRVRVIPTDEELMIARSVCRVLNLLPRRGRLS